MHQKQQNNRGQAKLDAIKNMNFFFIWGCRPSAGVGANTDMVQDIFDAFMIQQEPIDASIKLPTVFDYLQSSDASFETASSNQLQHLQLFYSYNTVTDSIGVIFYHNKTVSNKMENKLEKEYNLLEPCYRMLKNYIDLDRVHKFGNLSPS